MNTETFQWQEATIHYLHTGKGTRLLLLHGFGEDASIWQRQITALQADAEIVAPHLPGSGPSVPADHTDNYCSIDSMARMAIGLMDHLGWDDAIVLGHSMGGYITLAMAEKFPQRLKAFGLVHSTAFADSEEKKQTRVKAMEFINQYGSGEFLKTAIPGLFGPEYTAAHPQDIEQLVKAGAAFAPQALTAYYRTMMQRPDRTVVLTQARVPVLFVLGEYDKAAPKADVLKQVSLPACSYMHVLKHSGHMGMWEETEVMNAAIRAFILANA